MKYAVIASLIASAAAFAPAQSSAKNSALQASFEDALGAQKPLGFWDPLNFVEGQDQARFDRLRYVELKHGRIAMLAVAGHIAATAHPFEGAIALDGTTYASIKTGVAGLKDIPTEGVLQIVAFIGFLEVFVMKDKTGKAEFEGDFRNGFLDLGWDSLSAEEKLNKRAIELNQGRAAQMGILGLMVHEQLTGEPYVINEILGYHTV